ERQGVEQVPTIHEGHVAHEMGDRSERVQTNNDIKAGNRDSSSLSATIAKIQEEARKLFRQIAALTELIRKRAQEKAEAKRQVEQLAQTGAASRSAEAKPNVADNFLKQLGAGKAKQAKSAPPEESVAGDFLKKLYSDRSKRQDHKYRERTHDQGVPKL
ncbi:mobilization protein MobA, partial [Leuconostoc mesenteroides]|nr:mobilization protein MobA [Leuconostoc mesenteroides]